MKHTFIVLLLLSILAAWLYPALGSENTWFSPSECVGWGVSVIFLFYGLKLSPAKLRAGLTNFKLHALIQSATFILFPALILLTMCVAGDWQQTEQYYIWLGVFFVATLPSTVSSSVVMVSIARGNVPAAIFNASISSLIGVFLTPIWMSLFVASSNGGNSLSEVVIKLILQVILPVGVGMLLNRRLGNWTERHGRMLTRFDQTVILAIIYTAFCESFSGGFFDSTSWGELLVLTLAMIVLFVVVYLIIALACRYLKFSREDRTTALFCGSKKSLVHGTVMSKVLINDQAMLGVLLLPIMIYHALQLFLISIIAERMAHGSGSASGTIAD